MNAFEYADIHRRAISIAKRQLRKTPKKSKEEINRLETAIVILECLTKAAEGKSTSDTYGGPVDNY
jgi:hypothetical protein